MIVRQNAMYSGHGVPLFIAEIDPDRLCITEYIRLIFKNNI
jgi:hypothetical protein